MPMPVGGAFAIRGRTSGGYVEPTVDPELEEFRNQEKYILENITCDIEFTTAVIPHDKGKITGIMVLEAMEDVEHSGIFVLIKGLPLTEKKKRLPIGKKPLTEVKFMVIESTGGAGGERVVDTMQIDAGSKETYPVELDIPEELPLPLLTSRGRLIYRVHVCMYATTKKRHAVVGESSLRWQGHKRLELDEVKKELRIEQLVQSKRAMLGLGRRKSAMLEWKVAKGGYLPGEKVHVELWGECKDKDGLGIECKVELVQKVWYEVPSGVRSAKMWTKMKVNVLASGGTEEEEAIDVMCTKEEGDDGSKKILLWRGKLPVPRGITPTIRFDFMNSVSYTIRASAGVAGESKEGWVIGEVPLLIGTSKVVDDEDDLDGKNSDEDDEDGEYDEDSDTRSPSPSPVSPISPSNAAKGMHRQRSGSTGAPLCRSRSRSIGFIPRWTRARSGSISSMESLASSTLSIFRLPPSYSQLSSRRPTLETLPPAYSDLELHAHAAPLIVVHQQTEEDTNAPDMSNQSSDRVE